MQDPISAILYIIVLIFSVIIHELAHGYMADYFGDPTARLEGRLTLNPINHIDPFGSIILPLLTYMSGGFVIGWAKPVPYNPYNLSGRKAEIAVASAGVLANIGLAVVFSIIMRFSVGVLPPSFLLASTMIVMTNIMLFVFNLLPIPPLDGSRILAGLLSYKYMRIIDGLQNWGFLLLIGLVVFFGNYLSYLFSIVFSIFVGPGVLSALH